ncbi:DNA-(apurinic or apyrimidinic site) lyase 2 [Picochlorum sp. SENEW3]|nr:DNA-(apurinic or apyrimidinic site) lyase 2 [Picochlorum sp. SENEW3]
MLLKILSYNVNSLKAYMRRQEHTKLNDFLDDLDADIVCLQETKLSKADGEYVSCSLLARDSGKDEGANRYEGFLSFCEKKPGYSGVATFVNSRRLVPHTVDIGLFVPGSREHARLLQHLSSERLDELNSEGRVVVTHFDDFVLFNIYGPAVSSDAPERMAFKMDFYTALHVRCQCIAQRIIIVGDFNIAPHPIDSSFYNPCNSTSRPDRLWMKELLSPSGSSFVDCFRLFWPDRRDAYTAWNQKVNARDNNYGSRIDLCLAKGFDGGDVRIEASDICPDVLGSDHCPVYVTLSTTLPGGFGTPSRAIPKEAIRFVVGTQRTISSYFTAGLPHTRDAPTHQQQQPCPKRAKKQANLTSLCRGRDTSSLASSSSPSKMCSWLEEEYKASEEYARQCQADAARAWKSIQNAMPTVPTCRHGLEAALKKVRKNSKHKGRMFYCCPKSAGSGPQGQCNFFQWVSNTLKNSNE